MKRSNDEWLKLKKMSCLIRWERRLSIDETKREKERWIEKLWKESWIHRLGISSCTYSAELSSLSLE
jgi:hypothetical protein